MNERTISAAGKAVGTGAVVALAAGIAGKITAAIVPNWWAPTAARNGVFVAGMMGAGLVADPKDSEYSAACFAIGAGYATAIVAVSVFTPARAGITGGARGLPGGAPNDVVNAEYAGVDERGVPIYAAR